MVPYYIYNKIKCETGRRRSNRETSSPSSEGSRLLLFIILKVHEELSSNGDEVQHRYTVGVRSPPRKSTLYYILFSWRRYQWDCHPSPPTMAPWPRPRPSRWPASWRGRRRSFASSHLWICPKDTNSRLMSWDVAW